MPTRSKDLVGIFLIVTALIIESVAYLPPIVLTLRNRDKTKF